MRFDNEENCNSFLEEIGQEQDDGRTVPCRVSKTSLTFDTHISKGGELAINLSNSLRVRYFIQFLQLNCCPKSIFSYTTTKESYLNGYLSYYKNHPNALCFSKALFSKPGVFVKVENGAVHIGQEEIDKLKQWNFLKL